ncbi:uncharacterized protein LOC116428524 [Nomia melanderi]|uniref:uncharacterized protein LOC116428524 n=1 Tax=Nomia melanderi TaxID=2448451 RepID=UPI0013042C9D|nr:uncharacterized protein LOC116428524 [Nomia melanderi]XP_031836093.1 uncharacterized protein LOC116428524 [Nomia melanderi]
MSGEKQSDDVESTKWTGKVLGSAKSGISMQTRFQRMPDSLLPPTRDSVCGILDMNLGKVKAGQPAGAPIIRFDKGMRTGEPHINIDPKGFSHKSNPHIKVSKSTIGIAKTVNTSLKYAGAALTVAAVAVDAWRFGKAIANDIEITKNAPKIIAELMDSIAKLKKVLKVEEDPNKREEIQKAIEYLEAVLKDVRRTQKGVPAKTIKEGSSIVGGWTAGAAGGAAGAWAGAGTGAAIGSLFGPVGTVVGAPVGAIVGAIGLGIGAGVAGSTAGEYVADKSMELLVD